MGHPETQTRDLDLNELRRRRADAVTHRFTEADIAELEAEDLTDPWIIVMLKRRIGRPSREPRRETRLSGGRSTQSD